MTEEKLFDTDSVSDIALPEGVREALGRRLDRLSEEANALLQYAAVVGRQFAYDTLKLLAEHDDDTLLNLIEEGLAARVVEETAQPGRYQFTHALMQETLLDELSTTRRVRMHGRVADALEQRYGEDSERQASRLAHHFAESATLNHEHAQRAAYYSRLAGEQAESLFAWEEAAQHYDNCLASAGETESAQDEIGVLIAAGRCRVMLVQYRAASRHLLRAIELSRERADGVEMARAVSWWLKVPGPGPGRRVSLASEALELLGDAEPALAALLHMAVAIPEFVRAAEGPEAEAHAHAAAALAAEHDLPLIEGLLLERESRLNVSRGRIHDAVEHMRSAFKLFERAGRPPRGGQDVRSPPPRQQRRFG